MRRDEWNRLKVVFSMTDVPITDVSMYNHGLKLNNSDEENRRLCEAWANEIEAGIVASWQARADTIRREGRELPLQRTAVKRWREDREAEAKEC